MTLIFLLVMIILACCGLWRAALIMLGVTLLIDILIATLRVGARATLEEGVFFLTVIAGPVKLKLLPKGEKAEKPGQEKPEKKPEKKPKKKKEKPEGEKPEGESKKPKIEITLELITTVLSALGDALGRLRRKISIDMLTVHYTVASDDPFTAAMTYGRASAAVGALMPVIENIFKIKKSDVGASVTFDSDKPVIYIDAQLTIAIWEIVYIALAVWPVLKLVLAGLRKRKVEQNGQASDQ